MIATTRRTCQLSDSIANILEILVYIAMGAVVIALVLGMGSMSGGKIGPKTFNRSNKLMRWRVGIQFLAIALLAILVFVVKKN